jgi:signal transduction histidine kinase
MSGEAGMGQDLRSYLDRIKRDKPDELVIVSKEVDPAYEITALVVKLERERRRRPVIIFERVRGTRFPVITNLHASRSRLAMAMRAAPQEMLGAYLRAMDKPIPPRVVATGPVKDVILTGERLNLYDLPQIIHHEGDAGPYLTAAISFAKDLAGALALLGIMLAAATSIQIALGLRPLAALRRGIAEIRLGRSRRLPNAVPVEVRPLVEEVNAMLDTQEREISRSRGRAADLAHGLKTPLAALAADIGRLRERGESVIAGDIEALAGAMTRHVDRELAKARLHGGVRQGLSTELAPLIHSLIATLLRTPAGAEIRFEPYVSDSLLVPFDRTDLAEVLGNLLENATRHAASCVRVTASPGPTGVSIVIEDDGRGITPLARSKVLERGVRLDQRGDGTGLGLAIVQDLLDAYGWQLDLASSEIGGLKATIAPRSASIEPSASKALPT